MGGVFNLKCSKCDYESWWEMWIAHGYRKKHNTVEEIKDGLWGNELQEVIKNHHNHINIEENMFVCDTCRAIDVRPSLAYKICKKKLSCAGLADADAIIAEMKRHKREDFYKEVKSPHLCKECGTQMREIFNPEKEGPIFCPECGEVLIAKFSGVS